MVPAAFVNCQKHTNTQTNKQKKNISLQAAQVFKSAMNTTLETSLYIVYMHIKFGDSRFSRSGDMTASVETEDGSRDPDHAPFSVVWHPTARTTCVHNCSFNHSRDITRGST